MSRTTLFRAIAIFTLIAGNALLWGAREAAAARSQIYKCIWTPPWEEYICDGTCGGSGAGCCSSGGGFCKG